MAGSWRGPGVLPAIQAGPDTSFMLTGVRPRTWSATSLPIISDSSMLTVAPSPFLSRPRCCRRPGHDAVDGRQPEPGAPALRLGREERPETRAPQPPHQYLCSNFLFILV